MSGLGTIETLAVVPSSLLWVLSSRRRLLPPPLAIDASSLLPSMPRHVAQAHLNLWEKWSAALPLPGGVVPRSPVLPLVALRRRWGLPHHWVILLRPSASVRSKDPCWHCQIRSSDDQIHADMVGSTRF